MELEQRSIFNKSKWHVLKPAHQPGIHPIHSWKQVIHSPWQFLICTHFICKNWGFPAAELAGYRAIRIMSIWSQQAAGN